MYESQAGGTGSEPLRQDETGDRLWDTLQLVCSAPGVWESSPYGDIGGFGHHHFSGRCCTLKPGSDVDGIANQGVLVTRKGTRALGHRPACGDANADLQDIPAQFGFICGTVICIRSAAEMARATWSSRRIGTLKKAITASPRKWSTMPSCSMTISAAARKNSSRKGATTSTPRLCVAVVYPRQSAKRTEASQRRPASQCTLQALHKLGSGNCG